jgi:hypothetical protein
MAVSLTGDLGLWAYLKRMWSFANYGSDSGAPNYPIVKNNESVLAINAAGTGTVALIKASAADAVTIPGAVSATGAITPSAGIVPSAGSYAGPWAANYGPVAATSGTSTQGVANKQWISSLFIPANVTLTGLAFLIGTTGGTDKAIVALYDNAGNLVANSTTASSGTTVGTAANLQAIDFTATYAAVGPARYWASVQTNGTAAYIRTIPAFCSLGPVTSKTNASAVPAATITPVTTFTADVGPVCIPY